jgi:uncharacterized RDD family membrane protein YckC
LIRNIVQKYILILPEYAEGGLPGHTVAFWSMSSPGLDSANIYRHTPRDPASRRFRHSSTLTGGRHVQNPYTPPTSDLAAGAGDDSASALATRGQRLAAAMIDGIILMFVILPGFYMLGLWDAMSRGENSSLGTSLMAGVAGSIVYLLINGYLLATSGQTVGKRVIKIKIVGMDGVQPSLAHIVTRRILPTQLLSLIPGIGSLLGLVDTLFIFRADKRCVHDLIASTKVVNA